MSQTVLIAGGSGLLGNELAEKLFTQFYQVRILGREKRNDSKFKYFTWDPDQDEIDKDALSGVDYVINLAGANVGKGKWTEKRKKELLDSRINSTQLLSKNILANAIPIKKFIQASAIGYYGFDHGQLQVETDPAGKDFLATLTRQWEDSTRDLVKANIPITILRIGVVLSARGGALVEMAKPIRMYAGSYLGSGKQWVPWIHINDMISIFIKSVKDDQFTGIYNCVSPHPVTNKELTKKIAASIHRPAWPFGIPAFVLRLLLGEQSQIVLGGYHISNEKLSATGFVYDYPTLDKAIKDLVENNLRLK